MSAQKNGHVPIEWIRIKIPNDEMSKLNRRSDVRGFIQATGHLLVVACTGTVAFYSASHWAWWVTVALTFLHGTFWAFLLNGFHELCHGTVFKTKWLNSVFLQVYSFLGQFNYVHFQESHRRHHKYTLHPPGDLEVTLPIRTTLSGFLRTNIIDYRAIVNRPRWLFRHACGKLKGEWNERILPTAGKTRRPEFIRWARIIVVGHLIIVAVSITFKLWMIPVLVTFAPLYGTWLRFLCNETQHVGLQDNVPDFRLSCRTFKLNPFVRFLYWQMNYHIEHHMYAAVPCYNLGKLHRLIEDQLPQSPNGIVAVWREIIGILKRQGRDPSYQYVPDLPPPRAV